jgi:hypothetical protein
MASGQQVIIEGHISSRNDQRQGTFVAYIEEKEERRRVRDSDGDYRWKTTWETEDTFRQPLNIDTSQGTARISNSSYRLSSPRHTMTQYDHRWRGFKVGDRVMALGITRNAALNASVLHGGNKESYVSGQRLQATMLFWVGIVVVIGTTVIAGVYALRHG